MELSPELREQIERESTNIAFTGHREIRYKDLPDIRAGLEHLAYSLDYGKMIVMHNGFAQGFDAMAYDYFWPHEIIISVPHPVYRSQLTNMLKYVNVPEDFWRIDQHPCLTCYDGEVYFGPQRLMERNRHMVDSAKEVICYWNGVEKGGTWNTIQYARRVGKPIRDIREI